MEDLCNHNLILYVHKSLLLVQSYTPLAPGKYGSEFFCSLSGVPMTRHRPGISLSRLVRKACGSPGSTFKVKNV